MDGMAQSRTEIEADLYSHLVTQFPVLETCDADTPLLEGGIVDSIGVLELMTFLTERFGIAIDDADFTPENLETPSHIMRFVLRKQGQ